MIAAVAAVVAAVAVDGGGTAIALDDGAVWLVADDAWDELGGCDAGVDALDADGDALAIECADGTRWTWDRTSGWRGVSDDVAADAAGVDAPGLDPVVAPARSWWPELELTARAWLRRADTPAYEAWVRLRWTL